LIFVEGIKVILNLLIGTILKHFLKLTLLNETSLIFVEMLEGLAERLANE
jgi:hypothetical protein